MRLRSFEFFHINKQTRQQTLSTYLYVIKIHYKYLDLNFHLICSNNVFVFRYLVKKSMIDSVYKNCTAYENKIKQSSNM